MNVGELKKVKNRVIGNPDAKRQLAAQPGFIPTLVDYLSYPDLRIEAAHILSSISYGDHDALTSLLRSGSLRALLFAISNPTDTPTIRAFARALRSLAMAVAEVVGPSRWGLGIESPDVDEAVPTLDYLFHIDSLDVFLPLLVEQATSIYIAELLAFSIRSQEHRKAVTEWMPLAERMAHITSRRGWEKSTETVSNGGWVVRNLVSLLTSSSKDHKLQEAVLLALAALAQDNSLVARVLFYQDTLPFVLDLCKARNLNVQLAACLNATRIIRATPVSRTNPSPSCYECDTATREAAALSIINIINRLIIDDHTPQNKNKACFILYFLINDDAQLSHLAFERASLTKLSELLQSISPPPEQNDSPDLDSDEPESISALREAALTTIASIALFDNEIRRALTDDLHLLPLISASLASQHVGVKYGACQCVRSLSRSVAVLRTTVVDSGLGMKVFELFKRESEDRRVVGAAVKSVCNIVCEFSPLSPIYLEQGLMPRLVQLIASPDPSLRLNALWAVKNLVRKSSTETKKDVMHQLGWARLKELLRDPDEAIVEQALNTLRNLAENEEGIRMVFKEMGTKDLLDLLVGFLCQPGTTGVPSSPSSSTIPIPSPSSFVNSSASSSSPSAHPTPPPPLSISTSLSSQSTPSHDILLQTSFTLANLSNGPPPCQSSIISHPSLLPALRQTLADGNTEVRRPIVGMLFELAKSDSRWRREMISGGLMGTLKGLVGGKHGHGGHGPGVTIPTPGSPTMSSAGLGLSVSPTGTSGGGGVGTGSAGVGPGAVAAAAAAVSLSAGGRSPSWHAVPGHGHHSHGLNLSHAHSFGGRSLSHSTSSSGLGLALSNSGGSTPGVVGSGSGSGSGHGHSSSSTTHFTHPHPSIHAHSLSHSLSHSSLVHAHHAHSTTPHMHTHTMPIQTQVISEDDRDVIDRARQTLDWLEHGDVYGSGSVGVGS
ncbi:ARM repeat-containing protein, partial [Dendrothele bispora CBS 962.96]